MNSYNENLHSAVVNSLQSLELEQQTLNSQVNASMFTLYHAEGATITAEQNLSEAKAAFDFKTLVQNQAVKDSNLSVNLLNTATQANQYVKQSVNNVAVCASNVQIAANSIVRLASDIGSIFSIVNAADFDSDIYIQTESARELINQTAYEAEVASQQAMESSMLNAEVSTPTVLDMAKATNSMMATLLKVTTADFDNATQTMATDNAALGTIRSAEKLAEGALEGISVEYKATGYAYALTNKELNLDLQVSTSDSNSLSFTVDFDRIKSPFFVEKITSKPMYPVKDYYLMLVKESKKQTFSISNAETLQLKGNAEVISVESTEDPHIQQEVDVYTSERGKLVAITDSDNEEIRLGLNYVVFVMAVFEDDYKRKINCYDDYLSAPSQAFILTSKLESIPAAAISVQPYHYDDMSTPKELAAVESFKKEQLIKNTAEMEDNGVLADYTYVLRFDTQKSLDKEVEYRCMLLPLSPDIADNLLTADTLEFLADTEIATLEEISNEYDPQIAELQSDQYQSELKIELLEGELKELDEKLTSHLAGKDAATDPDTEESLKKQQQEIKAKIKEVNKTKNQDKGRLELLKKEKETSIKSLAVTKAEKPGFLFNTVIAEQVYADSYSVAKKIADKNNANEESGSQWIAFIGPDTTDNFGNRLNKEEVYLPVILSYSTAAEENAADFVNALSDMTNTKEFTY